jgi:hypothetical protein
MGLPINEDDFKEITGRVMRDESPLSVTLSIMEAWILVSNLQLANRHPGISDAMKGYVKKIAKRLEAAIVEKHPEAEPLIEMGWNSQFDVDRDDDYDDYDDDDEYDDYWDDDEYDDYWDDDDDDDPTFILDANPNLGKCCGCGIEGDQVINIVMLHYRAPESGKGWGCLQCGLPPDGASLVLCDACLKAERYTDVIVGYAGDNKRMPYAEFIKTAEPFDHDRTKHPELRYPPYEEDRGDIDTLSLLDEDVEDWWGED